MFKYSTCTQQVKHFCDDEGLVQDSGLIHNKYALNEQNKRCQLRSAWSVIRDHPDFARKFKDDLKITIFLG